MNTLEKCWKLKFWRLPHLGDVECLHGTNITHNYPTHIHEEYCVVIVIRGVETHLSRGKSFRAFPGCVMLLNPDEAHASNSVGTEYRIIHVGSKTLRRIGVETIGPQFTPPYFSDPVIRDHITFQSLLNWHLALEQKTSALEQESALFSALGTLLARQTGIQTVSRLPVREPRSVRLVQEYLKSNFSENISLSQLGSIANLSPFYLLRAFHSQIGVPPHEYQTQVRIARAKRLIHAGRSLADVAQETGFFDQSHLTRNNGAG